jgi:hypothetical protein
MYAVVYVRLRPSPPRLPVSLLGPIILHFNGFQALLVDSLDGMEHGRGTGNTIHICN